jgi:drug/metabolite transporter (DMT)-like permease
MRLIALTAFVLVGFASNSLLTRAAIFGGHLDPWTFMLVRLLTGTAMLAALVRMRGTPSRDRGSWLMSLALGGYAVLFTLAYVRIGAGPGALLLFGSVQLTMFIASHAHGERLLPRHWTGVALAVAGFLVLALPGLTAPDPLGALLMAGAGISWGAYSLLGRRSSDPLSVTADNFLRASAIVLIAALAMGLRGPHSATGFALATASGAIASGLVYAAWFALLPALPVWRAATIQLSVPVIIALGATIVLAEPITTRLGAALVLMVVGTWLTTTTPSRSR